MADGKARAWKQGNHISEAEVSVSVNGVRLTVHYSQKIREHVRGRKHRKYVYLQKKPDWLDKKWSSLALNGLKNAFLTLGPIKKIQCSKRIHGWLINSGEQNQQNVTKH